MAAHGSLAVLKKLLWLAPMCVVLTGWFVSRSEARQTVPTRLIQWQVTPGGNALMPGQQFHLFNRRVSRHIGYGKRSYGINLVWHERKPSTHFVVQRATSSTEPIKYGEPIALREMHLDGGYVQHKKRSYGIDLRWSRTPVYEWEFRGRRAGSVIGGEKEDITQVALFNRRTNRYMIYGDRSFGINLVWE